MSKKTKKTRIVRSVSDRELRLLLSLAESLNQYFQALNAPAWVRMNNAHTLWEHERARVD